MKIDSLLHEKIKKEKSSNHYGQPVLSRKVDVKLILGTVN